MEISEKMHGTVERLTLTDCLSKIQTYLSCVNSEVPEGRVWCNHFNQIFAGRCNTKCSGYQNRILEEQK